MAIPLEIPSVLLTVGKLFVLMSVGYLLFRLKLINKSCTDELSMLLVRVFFPALIISRTVAHFSFREYAGWWIMPLAAVFLILLGIIAAWILYWITGSGFTSKKEFFSVCSFQNCGYLPMNLILFTFAGALRERLLIHMFLFITGFNVLMWSVLPLVLSGSFKERVTWRTFFNSPVVATIISLLWVALIGRGTLPQVVAVPLEQLGTASFPIAMVTLGAYLAFYRAYAPEPRLPVFLAVTGKLLLVPLIALPVLFVLPLADDHRFFLFLQSLMPTAVSLVVIGSYTGSDNRFISSVIFYTHFFCLLTVPVWLILYKMMGF